MGRTGWLIRQILDLGSTKVEALYFALPQQHRPAGAEALDSILSLQQQYTANDNVVLSSFTNSGNDSDSFYKSRTITSA